MKSEVQRAAEALARDGIFIGGPVKSFDTMGRHQLVTLLEQGLMPTHKVLDLGCGCLRAGYWLMHFLGSGCYHGIEPNQTVLQAGLDTFFDKGFLELKQPRFDHNDRFDFSVFGTQFDFVLARSIWSHAPPQQIETMLDQFAQHAGPDGVFLTSYRPAKWNKRQHRGREWVGQSHTSVTDGYVRYRLGWIRNCCARRGLAVERLDHNITTQIWLKIARIER